MRGIGGRQKLEKCLFICHLSANNVDYKMNLSYYCSEGNEIFA